jgi:hypothetical protein
MISQNKTHFNEQKNIYHLFTVRYSQTLIVFLLTTINVI